jgi:DNA-binding HxlR family transcriptional regulator
MKKSEKKFCSVTHTLVIIGGKWKIVVISYLVSAGVLRYNELEKLIPGITPKMLVKVLKDLEAEKLVERKVFPEVPPRVEYTITELGRTLIPLISEIRKWGKFHKESMIESVSFETASHLPD